MTTDPKAKLAAEKGKSIQTSHREIVYDLCIVADKYAGRNVSIGEGITIDKLVDDIEKQLRDRYPSKEIVESVIKLARHTYSYGDRGPSYYTVDEIMAMLGMKS